ncbi:hypothetical protein DFH27DRAFT_604610 [Peziza echinospora]|nr:hypothetical protein DFH27DRAFT_604610 [Peziza echinospora]
MGVSPVSVSACVCLMVVALAVTELRQCGADELPLPALGLGLPPRFDPHRSMHICNLRDHGMSTGPLHRSRVLLGRRYCQTAEMQLATGDDRPRAGRKDAASNASRWRGSCGAAKAAERTRQTHGNPTHILRSQFPSTLSATPHAHSHTHAPAHTDAQTLQSAHAFCFTYL